MKTFGWDIVTATTVEHANRALQSSHDALLPSFSFHHAGYQIAGTFGNWRIVPGGSVQLLHLELPITSGKMAKENESAVDLAGTSVIVEVTLALLPAKGAASQKQLRFDFTGGPTRGPVKPVTVNDPADRLSSDRRFILRGAIPACLVANAAGISYVFATIGVVDPTTPSWLTPVQSDYTYVEVEGSKTGYLAILSATDSRDVSGLDRNVDTELLRGAGSGSFAISKAMFLKHVVLPTLPAIFKVSNEGTFYYHEASQTLRNRMEFETQAVQSGLIWYHPRIQQLIITTTQDSALACSVSGYCDMGLDIKCNFSVDSTSSLHFDPNTKALSFLRGNLSVHHNFQIPWYDYLIPGIAGIGDAILAAVVALISDGIASGLVNNPVSLSLAAHPPLSVRWSGMKAFDVKEVGLKDSFFMRGELT